MMCCDMSFPEEWMCSLTVMAPKVVGATWLTKFRPIAGLCAMRKVLGYVWLMSLPPLRYESVQTAFVPGAHADAGLFLLLQAAELSREWQREMVVVQLDVREAFDHVEHRAAFKAMKLQGLSLFSKALIAAIWRGSCMRETVMSSKIQMSRGLPQGAPESPVIFTMIMELMLRDLTRSWVSRKLVWSLYEFTLSAICYADDVVLVAASVAAAETMVSEVIAKLKEVGLSVGAQKTHWTSHPKMPDESIVVDGTAVLWEEVLEFVGSKVCLDGSARYAIAHRRLRLDIVKSTVWQALLWSSSVWTTIKAPRDKIASWSARIVANVVGVKKPPLMDGPVVETVAQNRTSRDREMQHELITAIRERVLGWAEHVARMDYGQSCARALRCRGLQWWRWETSALVRNREEQVGWTSPTEIQD